MAEGVRERMIRSAIALFAERGVQGTSFADVITHCGAPRGSIYHHFPGGKDELVRAVLTTMTAAGHRTLAPLKGRDAASVIDGFLDGWQRILESSDYAAGCSVLGVTVTTEDADVRAAAGQVFEAWAIELASLLRGSGVPEPTARPLAWARLRDQVDLDTLTAELLGVVDQTMQPTQASLWLRPQGPSSAAGGTVARQLAGRV